MIQYLCVNEIFSFYADGHTFLLMLLLSASHSSLNVFCRIYKKTVKTKSPWRRSFISFSVKAKQAVLQGISASSVNQMARPEHHHPVNYTTVVLSLCKVVSWIIDYWLQRRRTSFSSAAGLSRLCCHQPAAGSKCLPPFSCSPERRQGEEDEVTSASLNGVTV